MEGLAISPDGSTLVGIVQASLEQDKNKVVRIVTLDTATGVAHEYAYQRTTGSGVSEIVALNDHQFLVDERGGKGLGDGTTALVKQLFLIDLDGATDVGNRTGSTADQRALKAAAVKKTLVLDMVNLLAASGTRADQIPFKIESLAFGEDTTLNGVLSHTLYVANNNDFVPNTAGDNKIFVFDLSDADLGAVFTQPLIPEPESLARVLLGFGVVGSLRRRKSCLLQK